MSLYVIVIIVIQQWHLLLIVVTSDVPHESEQTADRRWVVTTVLEFTLEEVIQLRNDTQTSLKSEIITILVIMLTLLTGK